jgi:hypothetical protein
MPRPRRKSENSYTVSLRHTMLATPTSPLASMRKTVGPPGGHANQIKDEHARAKFGKAETLKLQHHFHLVVDVCGAPGRARYGEKRSRNGLQLRNFRRTLSEQLSAQCSRQSHKATPDEQNRTRFGGSSQRTRFGGNSHRTELLVLVARIDGHG